MLKTQVEPRAAGESEWFHCQVLNILWRHFIVYKSIDHRKLPSDVTRALSQWKVKLISPVIYPCYCKRQIDGSFLWSILL